jgi:hypothetical protein
MATKFDPKKMYSSGLDAGKPGGDKNKVEMMKTTQKLIQDKRIVTPKIPDDRKESITAYREGRTDNANNAVTLPAKVTSSGGGGGAPAISIQSEPPKPQYIPPTLVKIPSRDVVDYQDADIPIELITNLLFENLGANELVKFERHDTVEGTNATYDIISNLAGIKKEFDPSNLISRQKVDTSYFDIYNIKLDTKIPDITYLFRNNLDNYVYIDTNGDLVLELDNMNEDELVEVQIDSSGTIYKVTL